MHISRSTSQHADTVTGFCLQDGPPLKGREVPEDGATIPRADRRNSRRLRAGFSLVEPA